MKLTQYFRSIQQKFKPRQCNPQPGFWDSCEKCDKCTGRANFPEGGTPVPPGECCFLLEDNSGTLLMEVSGCLQPESC